MPNITNFSFAEPSSINNEKGHRELIDVIEVNGNTFIMAIVLSMTDYNPMIEHNCQIKIKSPRPSEEVLFETDKFIVNDGTPGEVGSEDIITGFSAGIKFVDIMFKGPGYYSVEVWFDDELLNTFAIPVTFKGGE